MSETVVLAEAVVFPAELVVALLLMALAAVVAVAVTAWSLGVASARGSRVAWALSSVAAALWILVHAGQGWTGLANPSLYTAPAVYAAGAWWGHHRRRTRTPPGQPPPPTGPGTLPPSTLSHPFPPPPGPSRPAGPPPFPPPPQ